jgi:hypothetical protein
MPDDPFTIVDTGESDEPRRPNRRERRAIAAVGRRAGRKIRRIKADIVTAHWRRQ